MAQAMGMRAIDEHIHDWTCFTEDDKGRLYRCATADEPYYQKRKDAGDAVLKALIEYRKALDEQR